MSQREPRRPGSRGNSPKRASVSTFKLVLANDPRPDPPGRKSRKGSPTKLPVARQTLISFSPPTSPRGPGILQRLRNTAEHAWISGIALLRSSWGAFRRRVGPSPVQKLLAIAAGLSALFYILSFLATQLRHQRAVAGKGELPLGCASSQMIDERPIADWAVSAKAMTLAILNLPHNPLMNRKRTAKLALLFIVHKRLPHQRLWAQFLQGHEGFYSIYVHTWRPTQAFKPANTPKCFVDRDLPWNHAQHPRPSPWAPMSLVDAQRRLLAWALLDPGNMFFVFFSAYCIPIRGFIPTYEYIIKSKQSFADVRDSSTGGTMLGYSQNMKPLIPPQHFATGTPWGTALDRAHATAVLADTMFYKDFKAYCRNRGGKVHAQLPQGHQGMPGGTLGEGTCIPEHHYIPTLLHTVDANGVNMRSLTYENASHLRPAWPTKRETNRDVENAPVPLRVTREFFDGIKAERAILRSPYEPQVQCLLNGGAQVCYLFARPFSIKQADALVGISLHLFT